MPVDDGNGTLNSSDEFIVDDAVNYELVQIETGDIFQVIFIRLFLSSPDSLKIRLPLVFFEI